AATVGVIGCNDAAAELHPGLLFDNSSDYIMWALAARQEKFAFPEDPEQMDGAALQNVVLQMIQSWHPNFQKLVCMSDPTTVNFIPIRTSVPIEHWTTQPNITLLG